VLVNNGTLAVHLALKALGLKGEIVTAPFSFAGNTNVIGSEALPRVLADIASSTLNIQPKQVEKEMTHKSCAILTTHDYGNPSDVDELESIAAKYSLKLIYDAAHALGVEYKNQSIADHGDISTLSFHAPNVFDSIDGGAIIAKDGPLFEKLKLLRNHVNFDLA